MVEMAEVGAPISLDGVEVRPDCAPENPEDGKMYLLVPAHPVCPRQSPESRKMVVLCVCVCVKNTHLNVSFIRTNQIRFN